MFVSLNDAAVYHPALAEGTTEIWFYHDPQILLAATIGNASSKINEKELSKTHVKMGSVAGRDPETLFAVLQGETYSPNGEACDLVKTVFGDKLARHTSMSCGDVVVIDGHAFMASPDGFVSLGSTKP